MANTFLVSRYVPDTLPKPHRLMQNCIVLQLRPFSKRQKIRLRKALLADS